MKSKKIILIILSVVFIGILVSILVFSKGEEIKPEYRNFETENEAKPENKISDVEYELLENSFEEKLKIEDTISEFLDCINNKDFEQLSEMYISEYFSLFGLNTKILQSKYESQFQKNYNLSEIDIKKDRAIVSFNLFEIKDNPRVTKQIFTVKKRENKYYIFDKEILSEKDSDIILNNTKLSVKINKIYSSSSGKYLDLTLTNKSQENIPVDTVYIIDKQKYKGTYINEDISELFVEKDSSKRCFIFFELFKFSENSLKKIEFNNVIVER